MATQNPSPLYVLQCSIRQCIQFGIICVSWVINSVEKQFRICFVFSQIPVFLGKVNGFVYEFKCTENIK